MTAYLAAAETEIDYDPLGFLDEIDTAPDWVRILDPVADLRLIRERERRDRKNRARRVLRERRHRARSRRRGWRA